MAFDAGKMAAGALLYLLLVGLPVVDLLLDESGLGNDILGRVAVGAGGVFAGGLAWRGFAGPPSTPPAPTYRRLRPGRLVLGLLLLALAWFTSLPRLLAGQVGGLGLSEDFLGGLVPRAVTMLLTMMALRTVQWGLRSPYPPPTPGASPMGGRTRPKA